MTAVGVVLAESEQQLEPFATLIYLTPVQSNCLSPGLRYVWKIAKGWRVLICTVLCE